MSNNLIQTGLTGNKINIQKPDLQLNLLQVPLLQLLVLPRTIAIHVVNTITSAVLVGFVMLYVDVLKKGHFAKVCISAKAVHSAAEVDKEPYHIASNSTKGLFVNMDIEGENVKVQINTGCGVSIVTVIK